MSCALVLDLICLSILTISLPKYKSAGLAQSVERRTLNPVVVGSSPTFGVIFCTFFVALVLRNSVAIWGEPCMETRLNRPDFRT